MQAFNETAKYFNVENLELLKSKTLEFIRTQKSFVIQVLDFFLLQVYKTIKTDEHRVIALVVVITLFFNLIFWYLFSTSKKVIRKLEVEIEDLRNEIEAAKTEGDIEFEKCNNSLAEFKKDNIELLTVLEAVKKTLDDIDMTVVHNNIEMLCDDLASVDNVVSNMKKENAKLFSLRKTVSQLKKNCAQNTKMIAATDDDLTMIKEELNMICRNEIEDEDVNDSDYVPSDYEVEENKNEGTISVESYNEKSFAVYGDTKRYKETLKAFGGKWNKNLKGRKGWIFSNKKRKQVDDWLSGLC